MTSHRLSAAVQVSISGIFFGGEAMELSTITYAGQDYTGHYYPFAWDAPQTMGDSQRLRSTQTFNTSGDDDDDD